MPRCKRGASSPFLNGNEITVESDLPIGILEWTAYPDALLSLADGDRIAIYTDGLLEARNRSGELYGFDRLRTLFSFSNSAKEAAEVGIDFGQDDDITVLTITRTTSDEFHAFQFFTPAQDPSDAEAG